ncbi:hypothetical protein CGMCC3_g446 [Colletotrichum fructicola]|nr:uncharacterized protein CGMCC3_g446 [Colletotrichum fructicola]KAE9583970.1 hypothetical protein CGMCC3_g446 [Colletotrichum fructicola]
MSMSLEIDIKQPADWRTRPSLLDRIAARAGTLCYLLAPPVF